MWRELLLIEAIQQHLVSHELENKQVIYSLFPVDSLEMFMGFAKLFCWDFSGPRSTVPEGSPWGEALLALLLKKSSWGVPGWPKCSVLLSSWYLQMGALPPSLAASFTKLFRHPCYVKTMSRPFLYKEGGLFLTLSTIWRADFIGKKGGSHEGSLEHKTTNTGIFSSHMPCLHLYKSSI